MPLFLTMPFLFFHPPQMPPAYLFHPSESRTTSDAPASVTLDIPKGCTDGWRITAYNFPYEGDMEGPRTTRLTFSDGTTRVFNNEFVAKVDDQQGTHGVGWGETLEGDAIGHYGPNDTWITSVSALDSRGTALEIGTAAVDTSVLPYGTHFTVPTLPGKWGLMVYTASDVGAAIDGKHVDIFSGEGKESEQAAYTITGNNGLENTLCVQ